MRAAGQKFGLRLASGCAISIAAAMMGGCEWDSYFDPSNAGRWEMTPTTVPILSSLAVVEDSASTDVEYTEVTADDLVPEVREYRIGPAEQLEVTIFGLFVPGQPQTDQRIVDSQGFVDLPQIGRVYVDGLTADEAEVAIRDAAQPIIADAVVSVVVLSRREETYSLIGSVSGPGTFVIPEADFRLLEALSLSGAFNEDAAELFVIRQVPLTGAVSGQTAPPSGGADRVIPGSGQGSGQGSGRGSGQPGAGEDLLRVIDELSDPTPPVPPGGSAPGVFGEGSSNVRGSGLQPGREAVVPLVEGRSQVEATRVEPTSSDEGATWMYLDGKWVMVRRQGTLSDDGGTSGGAVVTQRVIRVPVEALLAGDARYNIVIRPGDVIRVPRPPIGNIFMRGEIARPGVLNLAKQLTLTRAIDAAGGLGGLAIPERVDIVRMLPGDRQAWVRVNLRAIEQGTQPDIYLKANDRVVVGTNFWALPLAVARGGFRTSYGFGFLLDRNFGNDVFGAPPTNFRN